MKKLLPLLLLGLSTVSFANNQIYSYTQTKTDFTDMTIIKRINVKNPPTTTTNTLNTIIELMDNNEVFNFIKTIEKLKIIDYYHKEIKPIAKDNSIEYTYQNDDKNYPLQSISHSVSFGGLADDTLTQVYKRVSFIFKPEFCPSIDELKILFGEKLMEIPAPTYPSISRRPVPTADMQYRINTTNHLIFVENKGCQFDVMGIAKFE